MDPLSAINKGKRFEKFICEQIEEAGLGKARREIGSGSGKKKGDIFCNLPFLLEAKNQKHVDWWGSIDQAKRQAEIGNYNKDKWALIIRDPRTAEANPDVVVVMDLWQFLELLKKDSEPRIKEPDRDFKWKLQRLINYSKDLFKELD